MENQDWLHDPLVRIDGERLLYRATGNLDDKLAKRWQGYHISNRLKLEAARYFYERLRGAGTMPDDIGLPLLAREEFKWLDAFFFELASSYDILIQELNIAFGPHLAPEQVSFAAIKDALPDTLSHYMAAERQQSWFEKVQKHRDTSVIHSHTLASWQVASIGGSWDYDTHDVAIFYFEPATGKTVTDYISDCGACLDKMIEHVRHVWEEMTKAFGPGFIPLISPAYLRPYIESP